ncbi:MAG: hypothetical protein OXM56_10775, partial [Gammaproteobacteria bacterium]|nr:hypothetical protein [Gammaproteobacteria bacterium]
MPMQLSWDDYDTEETAGVIADLAVRDGTEPVAAPVEAVAPALETAPIAARLETAQAVGPMVSAPPPRAEAPVAPETVAPAADAAVNEAPREPEVALEAVSDTPLEVAPDLALELADEQSRERVTVDQKAMINCRA